MSAIDITKLTDEERLELLMLRLQYANTVVNAFDKLLSGRLTTFYDAATFQTVSTQIVELLNDINNQVKDDLGIT